jgi:exopolyphosphatase/guanosine-5'-triphosphate,3'-diphosphate pyrophosphatase
MSRRRSTPPADVVPLDRTVTLVGLAGSVTTVTAHALALAAYEPTAIHLSTAWTPPPGTRPATT